MELPANLSSLGDCAFASCTKLKKINFTGAAPQVGEYVFLSVTATVYFPADDASWENFDKLNYGGTITWVALCSEHSWVDADCTTPKKCTVCSVTEGDALGHDYSDGICERCNMPEGLKYQIINNSTVSITGYTGTVADLIIPAMIENLPVTEIRSMAFYQCETLTSIVIPEGITNIGSSAFQGCVNLEYVTLPDQMENIGSSAFQRCEKIKSIIVPEGITSLESTFNSCYSLESALLPTSLLDIGDMTFRYCYALSNVDIPQGVVKIGASAFDSCSFTNIDIPESVKFIGECAFINCSKLQSVEIPYGIPVIYDNTFNRCYGLQSITVPVTVKRIECYAFNQCTALVNVYYSGNEEQWERVDLQRDNYSLSLAVIHCLETEQDDGYVIENQVQFSDGYNPEYIDRVFLPDCAQGFYDWLVESTDGDGIYDDLIWDIEEAGGEFSYKYGYKVSIPVLAEISSEIVAKIEHERRAALKAMEIAFYLFRYDYPEIDWFGNAFQIGFSSSYDGNEGSIYIEFGVYCVTIDSSAYYASVALREETVENILAAVSEDMSTYELIRYFNAYLTRNNCYNTDYPDEPASAHKAITALVGNSGSEGPVCDAYAKAFKLLCNAVDIPCGYVTGTTNGNSHAWNVVQMEAGKWYAVDATWNDPSVEGLSSAISGYECEDYLLIGSETTIRNVKFAESHTPVTELEVSSNRCYKVCDYPELAGTAYSPDDTSEHIRVINKAVVPTCTEDGLREGVQCFICGEIIVEQEVIPALGHDYVDGVCTRCGEADPDAVELFSLYGANMTLGNALDMNFFISMSDLDGTDYYAEILRTYSDGREDVTLTIPYDQWADNGSYKMFTVTGIAAKEMTEEIYITIYKTDGTQVSYVWEDSVAGYVKRNIAKWTGETRTMGIDMLNYGAAAQEYFEYNLDDLANAGMEDYQQYATADVACVDSRVKGANYYGSNLTLESSIKLTMYFSKITPEMNAVVTFTDHYGRAQTVNIPGSEFQKNGSFYGIIIDELVLADCRQLVTCTVYDAEGNEVASAVDSVESYIARMSTNYPVFQKIMNFADGAYNYFH